MKALLVVATGLLTSWICSGAIWIAAAAPCSLATGVGRGDLSGNHLIHLVFAKLHGLCIGSKADRSEQKCRECDCLHEVILLNEGHRGPEGIIA